jgi:tRNA threonylcarbamoyladenosine biosynthesis protein TsaB
MLILGIETATPWGGLALCQDDEILAELSLKTGRGSGEYLLALLPTLMQKTGYALSQLELVAVGTGPGSYTGIRIGLAAAQGISAGIGVPLHGVGTLRTIAENARHCGAWIAAAIDARRGEVYGALYQGNGGVLTEVERPHPVKASEFAVRLGVLPEVWLCGNGGKVYSEVWATNPNIRIAPGGWDRPSAALTAQIALAEWQIGSHVELTADYLRRVEAEVRLEEKMREDQG